MSVFMIEPERLRTFPDSFLEYFLTQDNVSEITKVLIRDILSKRKEQEPKNV